MQLPRPEWPATLRRCHAPVNDRARPAPPPGYTQSVRLLSAPFRLVGLVLGVVLMIVGVALTMTNLLAFLGVPLLIVGVLLTARAIF